MKCLVKETFATVYEAYTRGTIVDFPADEALAHEYNQLVTILDRESHIPEAYETAEAAMPREVTAEPVAKIKAKRNRIKK